MNTRHPVLPQGHRPGRFLPGAALALSAALPLASQGAPDDLLLAAMTDDLRAPQLRCEWIAGEFDSIERRLSLYREELASIYVAVDGRTIGDSAGGAILAIEFDSRRTGPASMAIAVDGARLPAQLPLAPGRRIEAWFTDRGGQPHPLFCGLLAIARADAATRRIDLLGVVPRTGPEGRGDAQYVETTCVDVLKRLASPAGLVLDVEDRRRREVFPILARKQLADWPFIRQLARQCNYEIVLSPGGTLRVTESPFTPPAAIARQWSDVTLSDIARQVARDAGRQLDARLTASYPKISIIQTLPDADFLASTAGMFQVSTWFEPGRVMLAEDGAWRTPPAPAAGLMAGIATSLDELQSRITVMGRQDGRRAFTRQRADPALRQNDPERIPLVQTMLQLGRAMRAAEPPRFDPQDPATIAAALDRAIARLEKSADLTAEGRFLIGYARSYRPTLLYIYGRQRGGLAALDAIAP